MLGCFICTGSDKASGISQASSQSDEEKPFGEDPAYVELLNEVEMQEFGLDGVSTLPFSSCFYVIDKYVNNCSSTFKVLWITLKN